MRIVEEKEITKVVREEVTVKRICDNCHKEILISEVSCGNSLYNYFYIRTRHHDWGNDSVDSYASFDACCPKCALELAKVYIENCYDDYNTKTIEITHVASLKAGTDRTYKLDIAEE